MDRDGKTREPKPPNPQCDGFRTEAAAVTPLGACQRQIRVRRRDLGVLTSSVTIPLQLQHYRFCQAFRAIIDIIFVFVSCGTVTIVVLLFLPLLLVLRVTMTSSERTHSNQNRQVLCMLAATQRYTPLLW